jgi:hypothetical protein
MIRFIPLPHRIHAEPLTAEEERDIVDRMHVAYDEAKRLTELRDKTSERPWISAAIAAARLEGDELRGRLVLGHMRFAVYLAARYREDGSGWSLEELLSEVYTTMFTSAANFRNRRGKKFSNYVGYAIKRHLLVIQGAWPGKEKSKKQIKIRGAELMPHEAATQGTILDQLIEPDPTSREATALKAFRALPDRHQTALTLRLGLDSTGGMSCLEAGREMGMNGPRVQSACVVGLKYMREYFGE